MKEKVLVYWSCGKDSVLTLHALQEAGVYEVAALLTTLTEDYDRVSMHGVRRVLLEQQAASAGIPLEKVYISKDESNEAYEARMDKVLERYLMAGVSTVAIGDIFLEDLRAYREQELSKRGMKGLFPIWKRDTTELAQTFLELGFKGIITCVDTDTLDGRFAGRDYDEQFLADLPPEVDPCGENGEFHSFVYGGPVFREPVQIAVGEVVLRENRFCFCDVVPAGEGVSRLAQAQGRPCP